MEFQGKTVLITGGSSGIGKASAAVFLEAGARVFIMGRDASRREAALEELRKIAPSVETVAGDVSSADQCRRAVEETAARTGRLDVLVNSAGVYQEGPATEVTEEVWDRLVDINLKGTFFMCRYAIPHLEKTGGAIVNVSSDSGLVGNNQAAVYCATKGGVTLLTKALARELLVKGIRVNAVCPGIVETPMVARDFLESGYASREEYDRVCLRPYPEGTDRYTRPEEVARSIFFLASREKAEAVNGACLSIDFGLTAGY